MASTTYFRSWGLYRWFLQEEIRRLLKGVAGNWESDMSFRGAGIRQGIWGSAPKVLPESAPCAGGGLFILTPFIIIFQRKMMIFALTPLACLTTFFGAGAQDLGGAAPKPLPPLKRWTKLLKKEQKKAHLAPPGWGLRGGVADP